MRGQLARLLSITWNSASQTFMSRGPLQKTLNTCGPCSSMKIPSFGLCLLPLLGLCPRLRENSSVPPKVGRGPSLRNPDLETRAANVWDLVQSDQ